MLAISRHQEKILKPRVETELEKNQVWVMAAELRWEWVLAGPGDKVNRQWQ
jgi:hypothetical protein